MRLYLSILFVVLCTCSVYAQHSTQLDNSTGNIFLVTAPAGAGGTYTLPNGGGTIVTSTGTGTSITGNLSLTGANKTLLFTGNGTGTTTFTAGNQGATNIAYTLPIVAPTAGQVLSSTAAGVMSWTTPSGGLSFADFYALMPFDNAATVAVGSAVAFPNDGPSSSGSITRNSSTQFNLANIGTYEVYFQVSVTEAGQLMLRINGTELAYSVVGRATGTSQLSGMCLVTTTLANTTLDVVNPSGNSTALTITPLAGGTHAVSAHLVIKQIQ